MVEINKKSPIVVGDWLLTTSAFLLTTCFLSAIYIFDLVFNYKQQIFYIFYLPMLVQCLVLALACVIVYNSIPESCCNNLHITSWSIFSFLCLSVAYESHNILYLTLKMNTGNFSYEKDDRWRLPLNTF